MSTETLAPTLAALTAKDFVTDSSIFRRIYKTKSNANDWRSKRKYCNY